MIFMNQSELHFSVDQLAYFKLLAETLSFSKTAKKLGLGQPALSRSIRALERELGEALFSRTTRSMALTPFGRLTYQRSVKILGDFKQLKKESDSEKSVLRLGLPDNVMIHLIPGTLARLKPATPALELAVGTALENQIKLLREEIDLALFYHLSLNPGIQAKALFQTEFLLVHSPQLKITRENLSQYSWISSIQSNYERTYLAQELLQSLSVEMSPAITSNLQQGQIELCKQGLGFAIVPAFAVTSEVKRKELKSLDGHQRWKVPLYFAVRGQEPISAQAIQVISALKATYRELQKS